MMFMYAIIRAVAPAVIYFFVLWILKKKETGFIKPVLLHFLFGATVSILLGILGSKIFSFPLFYLFGNKYGKLLAMILIIPIAEELAKASILFYTVNNGKKKMTYGIIYGATVGLGFSVTENIIYFSMWETTETFLLLFLFRSIFPTAMHMLSTAIVGGMMCVENYPSKLSSKLLTLLGVLTAVIIHSVWNVSQYLIDSKLLGISFLSVAIIISVIAYKIFYEHEK